MSRGDRAATSGNLSTSMRDNYGEHGVSEYYKKVGSTYRNPHFPGVRQCIFSWLNKWWEMEQNNVATTEDAVLLFDMACGSGEATIAFAEWWKAGKTFYNQSILSPEKADMQSPLLLPRRRTRVITPPPLGPGFPDPRVLAADPYTSAAYSDRTSLPCATLSFKDISEGALPTVVSHLASLASQAPEAPAIASSVLRKSDDDAQPNFVMEMVICSFALHLVDSPSELFSLLWELSSKARWLVVLAPHKKPEIKDGWGWSKWNLDSWEVGQMTEQNGELLHDRVHCRVYRSLSV